MRKLLSLTSSISLAAALMLGGAWQKAHAHDYYFSFNSSGPAEYPGNPVIAGTVSGKIVGLADEGTSTPAHVYIDNYPLGLNLPITNHFDLMPLMAYAADSAYEQFTVTNGAITGGGYVAIGAFTTSLGTGYLRFYIDFFGRNDLENGLSANDTGNGYGLAGVTFTDVPEPASLTLFGAGLAGLARLRRR